MKVASGKGMTGKPYRPISVFQALWLRALNLNCGQVGFKRQSVACYAACSCMKVLRLRRSNAALSTEVMDGPSDVVGSWRVNAVAQSDLDHDAQP